MNILIIYPGSAGAGSTFSYEMANGFKKNGHTLYAVISKTSSNKEKWVDLVSEENVFLFETHNNGSSKDFVMKLMTFYFTSGLQLKRKFKQNKFDLIVKPMYHIWSDFLMSCVSGKKVLAVCHDPIPHSGEKAYVKLLYKKFTENTDELAVLTKSFIPIVEKRFGIKREHIHYMPHGRFPGYIVNPEKRLANFSEEKTNFVFFGRIQKYKGIGVLLQAYQMLRRECDDITLTIAGNGNMEPYQQYLTGDESIKVINRFIDDDEVGSLFDGPNAILVLPYIDATQSGVTLVAFEYGVPIIATNTGGLKEQLNDGKIGLLCEPNNAESLYNSMKKCINNPEFIHEQKRLTEEYLHELDWDVLTAKLVREIYGEK